MNWKKKKKLMKITRLEKQSRYNPDEVRITVEITLSKAELGMLEYQGFDLFPDFLIPELLITAGNKYKGKVKDGRIKDNDF